MLTRAFMTERAIRRADRLSGPDSCGWRVLDTLAEARDRGRRVLSICNGAFALAAAGVLDGLHATTH